MSSDIQKITELDTVVYNTVESVLGEWNFENNLQFPTLIQKVAVKLNVNKDSEVKELDAQVRRFIRLHTQYESNRRAPQRYPSL